MPTNSGVQDMVQSLDQQFGSSTPAASPAVPSTSTPEDMVSALDKQFGSSPGAAGPPGFWSSLAKGAVQGVHDVTDWPAEQLAKVPDVLGLTSNYSKKLQAQDTALRSQFNASNSGNLPAQIGRIGGQVALTLPILGAGGKLAGTVAKSAIDAYGPASTTGKTIQGVSNLLSGTAGKDMPGAAGLVTRAASKAAQGAVLGGGSTLLTSPGSGGSPVSEGLGGAETGAIIGSAIPVVGGIASPLVKTLGALKGAATEVSEGATSKAGANLLVKALKADGMTPDQALTTLKKMGPDATLADVGGANVRNLAESVANSPGPGAQTAQYLENLMESQPTRISDALQGATGQTGDTFQQVQKLMEQRVKESAPLYQKAFSNSLPTDNPRLVQFLADPSVKKGFDTGLQINRLEALAKGEPFDPLEYTGGAGEEGPILPSMKAADAAKKGLDDMIEQYRDPVTGKLVLDSQGRALNNVKTALLDHLDSINPDYAAARASWAGPSHAMDLVGMGQRVLSTDPSVTAKTVGALSDGDKAFFLNGVTKAIQDKIDGTPDGASAVRRIFGNTAIRAKIESAFGSPTAFNDFAQKMQAEAQYAATRGQVLGGSQTARRLAGMSDVGVNWTPHVVNLLAGSPGEAAMGIAREAGNYLSAPSSKQMEAVGKVLFNPDSEFVQQELRKGMPTAAQQLLENSLV